MPNPTGEQPTRIDFGCVAEDYEITRGIPTEFKNQIIDDIIRCTELTPESFLLEIGCGTGRFLREFADHNISVIGVDISKQMLEVAREKGQSTSSPRINLLLADAVSLPFPRGVFNGVLAIHIFHLLSDWREGIKETIRQLRPDGTVITGVIEAPMRSSMLYQLYRQRREEMGYPGRFVGPERDELVAELDAQGATIEVHEFREEVGVSLRETLECLDRRVFSSMWRNLPDVIHRRIMKELRDFTTTQFRSSDTEEQLEIKAYLQYARFG